MDSGNGSISANHEFAGLRVLVAEDSWHVAKALASVLENLGLSVMGPTACVAGAHELLDQGAPDLAVVDINLRGELSCNLIEQLNDRGVPVIVVTGYGYGINPISGASVVLQKPFSGSALVASIHQVLKGGRSRKLSPN